MGVLDKILRAGEGKTLRKLEGMVKAVNAIEADFVDLTDAELRALTDPSRVHRVPDYTGASREERVERLLGVRHETLETYGAVSEQTVLEMARGARQALAGAVPVEQVIGVSVSGIAGPGGGMPGKPVGLTWIGLSAPGFEGAWHYVWFGDRTENKVSSAHQALRLVLDYLKGV